MRCDTCIRRRVMRDGKGFIQICMAGMSMSSSESCPWYMNDDYTDEDYTDEDYTEVEQ